MLAELVDSGFTIESLLNNRTALMEFFSKMSEGSIEQIEDSYLIMYRGQMNALLKRPEIQVEYSLPLQPTERVFCYLFVDSSITPSKLLGTFIYIFHKSIMSSLGSPCA